MTEPSATRPPSRRGAPRLALAVALAAAAVLAVRAALPFAAARAIERAARRAGIAARVADVDLWLLRGALALEGVAVGGAAEGTGPASGVRVARLFADLAWAELLAGRIRLSEVHVEAPVAEAALRADGSIALPLAPDAPGRATSQGTEGVPPSAAEGAPPASPSSTPERAPATATEGATAGSAGEAWPFAVDRARVSGAELRIADPRKEAPDLELALAEVALESLAAEGGRVTIGEIALRDPRLRVDRDLLLGARPRDPTGLEPRAPPEPPGPAARALVSREEPSEPAPPASASPPPSSAPAPSAPPAPEPPLAGAAGEVALSPHHRIARVAIERAGLTLSTPGGALEAELDLDAEGLTLAPGERFPIRVAMRHGGGELLAEGRAAVAPPGFTGSVRWRDLPLPPLTLAARPEAAAWIHSCSAAGDLAVDVRVGALPGAPEPPGLRASGTLAVRDLAFSDPEGEEVELRLRELSVGVREAVLAIDGGSPRAPLRVALERVRIVDPALRYARPTPALDAFLAGGRASAPQGEGAAETAAALGAAEAPGTAAAPAAIELALDALELSGGALDFADATRDPAYRGGVRALAVAARDLRWPGLRARDVRARGVAPERAPFRLEGGVDGATGRFALEIQRLDLPALNSYAEAAGYRIAAGEATLQAALAIDPERYRAENDLRLHALRMGSVDPGRFEAEHGTSLPLALALLRDRSGDIRLPVPISVERGELRFGLGRIVRGALRQALVGVLSSPLRAIGAALTRGGGATAVAAPFPAAAGSAAVDPAELARVDALAELLRARPLLGLELRGRAGPADRALLAERLLVDRVAVGEALPDVEGAGLLAPRRVAQALRARARGAPGPLSAEDEALLRRYVDATQVPAERFAALARARAAAVRELLLGRGVDPGQASEAEPDLAGAPGVAVSLVALEPAA